MTQALHAEWTKLRTVAGTIWLLVAVIALTVALSAAAAAAIECPSADCGQDPAKISLTGIAFGQAVVAILAVLAVSSEYSTGMIRLTFAAIPRRTTVLAAKAAIVSWLVLVAGTVAVLACLLTGRLLLPGNGFTAAHGYQALSLAHGPVLRAAAGSVLYLVLIGLLSLGVAGRRDSHRDRARAAVPLPDNRHRGRRPGLVPAPAADLAYDRGIGHPGHHQPQQPARRSLGGPRRARRMGRGALLAGGLVLRLRDA
jgi:hypothetical protein